MNKFSLHFTTLTYSEVIRAFYPKSRNLIQELLDGPHEGGLRDSTDNGVNLLAPLKDHACGDGANAVLHVAYVTVPGVGAGDGYELLVPLVLLVQPVATGDPITLCYNNPLFHRNYTPGSAPRRSPSFDSEDTLAFVSHLNPGADVLAALSALYVSPDPDELPRARGRRQARPPRLRHGARARRVATLGRSGGATAAEHALDTAAGV